MTNTRLELQVSNNNSVPCDAKGNKNYLKKNVSYDIVVSKFKSTCDIIS